MTDFPLGALILPEPAAEEAWRVWRASLDIDTMPYRSQQLIPALAGRLPRWLERDASAGRFQGIVKMAWSRNQVRLHRAAELRRTLHRGSVAPALIAGPLAWSLVTREEGAIRFIPYLTLLIPRQQVAHAASVLAADGWELNSQVPGPDGFNWSSHIELTKGDDILHLHWRLLPTSPADALAAERAFLQHTRAVVWKQHAFRALSAEADLLYRLTDRLHWDPAPWQADVLMTPFDAIDWDRFRALASRFSSAGTASVSETDDSQTCDAVSRLMALRREWQLPIPEIRPAASHTRAPLAASPSFSGARLGRLLRRVSGRGRLLWRS